MKRFSALVALPALTWACRAAAFPFPDTACDPSQNATINVVQNVATQGGTLALQGSGFGLGFQPWITSPMTALQVLSYDGGYAFATVPAMDAGLYTLLVNDLSCAQSTYPQALTVSSTTTPSIIWGTSLVGDYIAQHAICSGSCGTPPLYGNCSNGQTITWLCDETGNGNHIQCPTGPTMIVNDTAYLLPSTWSVSFNGTTQYCLTSSIPTSGATGAMIGGAFDYRDTSNYGTEYFSGPTGEAFGGLVSGGNYALRGSYGTLTTNTYPVGAPAIWLVGFDANTGEHIVQLNNGAINSLTDSSSAGTPTYISFGADIGPPVNTFVNMSFAEAYVIDRFATGTEGTQATAYLNARWGVTVPPTYTASTQLPANTTNAPLRIAGAGFQPGVTVAVNNVPCAVQSNTTVTVDVLCPSTAPGMYSVTLTNLDGNSATYPNVISATTAVTNWSIIGLALVGDYEAAAVCSGGPCTTGAGVQTWTDLSVANAAGLYQATSANQPTYTVANSSFNNAPTLTGNGTSQTLENSSYYLAASNVATLTYVLVASTPDTTSTSIGAFNFLYNFHAQIGWKAGKPNFWGDEGYPITWGSVANTPEMLTGYVTPASTLGSINVANGTATTGTATSQAIGSAGSAEAFGSDFGTAYTSMTAAELLVIARALTGPEQTAIHSLVTAAYGVP